MLDVETGPNRRISRSRKRGSLTTQEHVKTTSSGGDGAENRTCSVSCLIVFTSLIVFKDLIVFTDHPFHVRLKNHSF